MERFTGLGRSVTALAVGEARKAPHKSVGTEHLLLALCLVEGSISRSVLDSLGVRAPEVRAEINAALEPDPAPPPEDISFTARAKKVLELALEEGRSLGHKEIGTGHVLLGLIREEHGGAIQILRALGAEPEQARQATLQALGVHSVTAPVDQPAPPVENESAEAVPTHQDRPAKRDRLGRARLAAVLGERIRRVRGEDTETMVDSRRLRRRKLAADTQAARRTGNFMVHVYAPWGAGKSSLLNFLAVDLRNRRHDPDDGGEPTSSPPTGRPLIERLLRTRRPANPSLSQWIVVEFSAWEHQRLVAPWWWLLAAVQRSCARELWQINRGRWLWFWIRDIAWRLWNARAALIALLLLVAAITAAWAFDWFGFSGQPLTSVRTGVLTATAVIAFAGSIVGLAHGAGKWLAIGSAEGAVRFLKRAHDPLGVYRRRFRWLVRSAGRPITVFIDDLDRCRPEYVVELLEGIQTIFAEEPVAYVIAADRGWLCDSFAHEYREFVGPDNESGRPLGFLFIEKTFQISLEIPPLSPDDRSSFWSSLTRASPNGSPRAKVDATALSGQLASASSQSEVEEGVGDLLDRGHDADHVFQAAVRRLNAPELEEETDMLLDEFAPLVENNPRSMKRLMNAYGIERDRLLREGYLLSKVERQQLVLLTILRLRWPLLADHLRATPSDVRFCNGDLPCDDAHPFAKLFRDPGVRRLFDASEVDVRLEAGQLAQFPKRLPRRH